jgi:hypothetical protein
VRSLSDLGSLEHSATLDADTGGLASGQSNSVIQENPGRFYGKVMIFDFDYNAVLDTAPSSMLKLPVDWPATKKERYPGVLFLQYSRQSAPAGDRIAARQLVSIESLGPETLE